MKVSRFLLLIAVLACAACTTIAPVGTVGPTVPGTSAGASTSSLPSTSSLSSAAPIESEAATTPAATTPATVPPTTEPTPTEPPTEHPTPKPTKKPTPTPSPTPTPTPVDVAIFVQTADLPNPWYNDTDYVIPIHVSAAAHDIPGAQVKVSIPLEAFSTTYTTGPITDGSEDVTNVTINVPAIGPATLILQVKTPAGFADLVPSNNKVMISIDVQLKP